MIRKLTLIYMLLFCASSYADTFREYKIDEVIFSEGTNIVTDKTGKPINGIIRRANENGELYCETLFRNGLLDGITKIYYADGIIQYEIPYKKNRRDGIIFEYFENGGIKSEFPFKNDVENGMYKEYNNNGTVIRELSFLDGSMEGYEKRYNDKGELWVEVFYKNDYAVKGTCLKGRRRVNLTEKLLNEWNNGNTSICE